MKRKNEKAARVPRQRQSKEGIGNSYLHVETRRDPLFAPPPFIVETVFFSGVGHTFCPAPSLPWQPSMYIVQDFLFEQTGVSGSDGQMSNVKNFDLTTATSYRFNVFPRDRAKRIKVVPPAGAQVFFRFQAGRRFVTPASDVMDTYVPQSFFMYLAGPTPALSYNQFSIGRNTNHWLQFVVHGDVSSAISFSGFVTIGNYPMRTFDPGLKSYNPYSTALPHCLPGPNSVPFFLFSYATKNSTDPGPFVFLS